MTFGFTRRRDGHVAQRAFAFHRLNSIMSRGWMLCLWRWQITVSQ